MSEKSISAIKYMAAGKQQSLEFINNCSHDVIMGNENGLFSAINNLLSNAIKFTHKKGKITVILDSVPSGYLFVQVSDTGIGIAQEKLPTLFDKFTITSHHGTCGEIGTGLGMSIVKEIIEKHNGWIEVDSTVGKGTSFKLFFPQSSDAARKSCLLEIDETEETAPSCETKCSRELKRRKILLVEDDLINQKITERMILKAGYEVEIAENGKEAVVIYTRCPNDFALIFMDIKMTKLDGKEAASIIRVKGFNTIPIIAMTALDSEEERQNCFDAGMNDYVVKPLTHDILVELIKKWVFEKNSLNA